MKIGAHVSSVGGVDKCIDRAAALGANCCQFFISPPQQWAKTSHSEQEIQGFKTKVNELKIYPNFIHGTYLLNLATQNPANLEKTIDWLVYALNLAEKLGVTGVIFHTGSHGRRGFEATVDQIIRSINTVLLEDSSTSSQNDNPPYLILENSSGGGGSIGNFSELGQIIKSVINKRVKICIDTCHAYTFGYDIKNHLDEVLEEVDKEIGLENLVALHANDCKFDLGSKKDRHENIGEGFLGKDGFKNLLNHPKLKDLPFILEVPGFDGTGPDRKNVETLQKLSEYLP